MNRVQRAAQLINGRTCDSTPSRCHRNSVVPSLAPSKSNKSKAKRNGDKSSNEERCKFCGRSPGSPLPPTSVPTKSAKSVQSVKSENYELNEIRKLIKMKVPKPAVIQKMKQNGIDSSIIMKYELSGKLPSNPSGVSSASFANHGVGTKEVESQAVDPALAKYVKMKKLKLPDLSIRNRMERDGISQQVIDNFFGTESDNTTNQKHKMKHQMATNQINPETKMKMKSPVKWPEGLRPKPTVTPGQRMKAFQWTKLDPFRVQTSIWSECDDEKIDFDHNGFEAMFGQKVVAKKQSVPKSKKVVVDEIRILDPKRSYNVAIFLGRLRMEPQTVRDCILKMDESICNGDKAGKWKNFVPDPKEAAMFDGLMPCDVGNLAKPERFFFVLKDIDKNLPQRLELWEFKMNFDKIMEMERANVRALQMAHQCIRESNSLRVLLSTILAFGNHMNGGTHRGQAHGFKLSSLSQLTRSRAKDNKMSLLEYLYLYLEQKKPAVINFPEEWSALEEAVHVDIPSLRKNVAQIGTKLKMIERRIGAESLLSGDRFSEVMAPFHVSALQQYASLTKEHQQVIKDLSILATFLGEAKDTTAVFLKTLFKFRREFMETAKRCAERKQREEKRKKTKHWNAARKASNIRKRGATAPTCVSVNPFVVTKVGAKRTIATRARSVTEPKTKNTSNPENDVGILPKDEKMIVIR